jgi:hypothetical protein
MTTVAIGVVVPTAMTFLAGLLGIKLPQLPGKKKE